MGDIEKLVRQLGSLPTLPDVALRAQELLGSPESSLQEVADVIARDPVLAGRIARMANSSLYGGGQQHYSLSQAVQRLGTKETRRVVMTVAVTQAVPELPQPLTIHSFWCLGLATALSAQKLSEDLKYPEPDQAYLAGLLHTLGEAWMAVGAPKRFAKAVEYSRSHGCDLHAGIIHEFQIAAPELCAYLLRDWGIAESIADATQHYLDPSAASADPMLAGILFTADRMCRGLGLVPEAHGEADDSWSESIPDTVADAIGALGYQDISLYLLQQFQFLLGVEQLVTETFGS